MWFGKRHDAPIYADSPQTETPVGTTCCGCGERIDAGDDGWFYANGPAAHRECFLRPVFGSILHQQQKCSCFVADAPEQSDGTCVLAVEGFRRTITCLRCGMTSYNPYDVQWRYCGECHRWHTEHIKLSKREEARGAVAYYFIHHGGRGQ